MGVIIRKSEDQNFVLLTPIDPDREQSRLPFRGWCDLLLKMVEFENYSELECS